MQDVLLQEGPLRRWKEAGQFQREPFTQNTHFQDQTKKNKHASKLVQEKLFQLTNSATRYFKGDMASVGSFNKGAEFVLRYLRSFHKMKVCDLSPQDNRKNQ